MQGFLRNLFKKGLNFSAVYIVRLDENSQLNVVNPKVIRCEIAITGRRSSSFPLVRLTAVNLITKPCPSQIKFFQINVVALLSWTFTIWRVHILSFFWVTVVCNCTTVISVKSVHLHEVSMKFSVSISFTSHETWNMFFMENFDQDDAKFW